MDLDKFDSSSDIRELLAIRDDIEKLSQAHPSSSTINVDLIDLGDAYQLIADLPGVSQEKLEIALYSHSLTIATVRDELDDTLHVISTERPKGHAQRELDLPSEINPEASSAHLQGGVLTLTLPKAK